jgi:hypothetical protein
MIRNFANLRIIEILPPWQGWRIFNVGSRADALRLILSPRWGGQKFTNANGNSNAKFEKRKVKKIVASLQLRI